MTLTCAGTAWADYRPILLTSNSYNHDVVVEKTAPPPVVPVTTASMDNGMSNIGFAWFERGYYLDWPATGLPEAGSILTSDAAAQHQFKFATSYKTNNVFFVDSSCSKATVILKRPLAYSKISFLNSSGGRAKTFLTYTLHFQDGSQELGTFTSPEWVGGTGPAWAANGCINVTTFAYDMLNSDNPRLFSTDITVTNSLMPLSSIDLEYLNGSGHAAIFAVSGTPVEGDPFSPINVSGYNHDVIVEASARKPGWLTGSTTATMDNGMANSRTTWYERGYYPMALETGLPAPGTSFTCEQDPGHRFIMPPSYSDNNAVLIDALQTEATLTLSTPAPYLGLSFLTASGHGPVTNLCVVNHSDGTSETNSFISPDWYDHLPPAFAAQGCVSVSTRLVSALNSNSPRLFAIDFPLNNSKSAVTNLWLSFGGGGNDSHAIIFALSGATDSPPVQIPRLSIAHGLDGALIIHSSAAGLLQSTPALKGAATVWNNEREIFETVTLIPSSNEPARFYRVIAP